jgi:hypothetical protein
MQIENTVSFYLLGILWSIVSYSSFNFCYIIYFIINNCIQCHLAKTPYLLQLLGVDEKKAN